MKTSLIFLLALTLNSSLLLADMIIEFAEEVSPWLFLILEGILLLGFFLNEWFKKQRQWIGREVACKNVFMLKEPSK